MRRPYVDPEAEALAVKRNVLRFLVEAIEECPRGGDGSVDVRLAQVRLGRTWWRWRDVLPKPVKRRGRRVFTAAMLDDLHEQVKQMDAALAFLPRVDALVPRGMLTSHEIKRHLRAMRWSQARFARAIGVSTQAVSRWCRGIHPIPDWAARHLLFLSSTSS